MECSRARLLLIALSAFAAPLAWAGGGGPAARISLTPLIGFEEVTKSVPTTHSRDILAYGARLVMGPPRLSLEGEYLRSDDQEAFSAQDLSTRDITQKIKVGLRSLWYLGAQLNFIARGGVDSRQSKHTESVGGLESVNQTSTWASHPYVGTGLKLSLRRSFSLTGEIVAILQDKNSYETSLGLQISIP